MAAVASFWDTNMAAVTSCERGVLEEITKARNRLLIKQSTQALLLLAVKITLALIWLCFCNGIFKGQIKLQTSPDLRSQLGVSILIC